MAIPLRLLIIEDNLSDAELAIHSLRRAGYEPISDRVETEFDYRARLGETPDIILADYNMPEFDPLRALEIVQEERLDIPLIVVSGSIGEEIAVDVMRHGAADYLMKDRLGRLGQAVAQALEKKHLRNEIRRAEQAVGLSEERLRQFVEHVSAPIAMFDRDMRYLYVSRRWLTDYRLGVRDVIGLSHYDVFPDAPPRWKEIHQRCLAGVIDQCDEERFVRGDGTVQWIRWEIRPWTAANGAIGGIIMFTEDISERKRSEHAIQVSEERLRLLVSAITAIVWNSPPSGRFDSEQPGWTAFTGQTLEQHRGWGWLDAIHPDDREKSALAWASSVAQRTEYGIEHRLRRADGEYRMMSARAIPILEQDGGIREWVGVHTDVQELRLVQERLQYIVASSPTVLFTLEIVGEELQGITWMSDNLLEIFGHHPPDALGQEWWSANVHPDDLESTVAETRAKLFRLGRTNHEYRLRHGDGTYRWTGAVLRLIRDAEGRAIEVVGALTDISDRTKLQEQLRQSQKMDAFGQLAGGVAHDFNNLLTIILGYSEIVLASLPPGDPNEEMIQETHNAGMRASLLTRQLLAFSRKQVVQTRVIDLNDVVTATQNMLGRLIGEDVKLVTALAPRLNRVRSDPGQLEQVIVNLVVNARDAMPQGGQITMETANVELDKAYGDNHPGVTPGRFVMLAVSDTGIGMSESIQRQIFEPFFTTKDVGKGSGLGLATVFGIVKQAGGQIGVYSEVGRGTTFKIYFPSVEGEVPDFPPGGSPVVVTKRGDETILIVEDEGGVRSLMRSSLGKQGYTIHEARDGSEALRFCENGNETIHLLITDVVMPQMGGRDLAERLRKRYPKLRILFVSGYTDDAVVRHGILEAEVAFLQKPFTVGALARKVRAVLDAPFT